jgi:acetyl esterase/lipase
VPSSPEAYVRADAPPFFVAHGDRDTVVLVEDARVFVDRVRRSSSNPVVYAELPGAQHTFDLFDSIRFDTAVDAIEAFAAWVRSRDQTPAGGGRDRPEGGVRDAARSRSPARPSIRSRRRG